MTRMTAKQIADLNMRGEPARSAGLGTRLDALEYGTVATPAVGTVTPTSATKYTVAPVLQTTNGTKTAFTLLVGAQPGITAGINQPDVPRIVTVKGNDANVTGNVVVHGTNFAGTTMIDTIALNGTAEVLGIKAFKTITSIDYPAYAVAGTETVVVGRGVKIGFPVALSNAALCFAKNFDGAADAGTVTTSGTLETSLYAVAGTMNGAKLVDLFFFS